MWELYYIMQKLLEFSIYFCFLCWSSCSEVRKEPFPDYDNVFACSADYYDDDNTKDINNELDKINLHYIDAYFFIIFCPGFNNNYLSFIKI